MNQNSFSGKKIAVIGLGVEGLSSARYLSSKGAKVTVFDQKKKDEIDKGTLEQVKNLDFVLGENYLDHLKGYDLVVKSPGIKRELIEKVTDSPITSQTKLFFDLSPAEIIGVTGTKGKGTTSSLIYEMLTKEGIDAYLGGNIGVPPFDFLDKLSTRSIVVLELSSFQLLDLTKSPHIGVILMITSEHLNFHKDIEEYINAKRNLIRFQTPEDFAVLNRDYPPSNESDIFTEGDVYHVSRERRVYNNGCFIEDKAIWIQIEGNKEKIIDTSEILLPGKHNYENECAAVMASVLAGVSIDSVSEVLKTFKGLEHRIELVEIVSGVAYYDDSFSTTPEATIAAIEAFANPEILILGGSSKGSDFKELGHVLSTKENIKAVIGIGEEWEKIKEHIKDPVSSFAVIEGAKDMPTIVTAISKIALPGDVVLLSPGCTSFGMFKNYKDRGEQFKKEVRKLKNSLN